MTSVSVSMTSATATSAPVSVFNLPDDDAVQYGLAHNLTLRTTLSTSDHLRHLYALLHDTRTPVRDNHSKRARKATDAIAAERPTFAQPTTPPWTPRAPKALEALDYRHRTLAERAFTARGMLLDELDLGFAAGGMALEMREVVADAARLRDPDLRAVWLPVRSEAWTATEGLVEWTGAVPEDGPLDFGEAVQRPEGDAMAWERSVERVHIKERDVCLSPVLLPMADNDFCAMGPGRRDTAVALDLLSDPCSLRSDDATAVEHAIGVGSERLVLPSPCATPRDVDLISLETLVGRGPSETAMRLESPMILISSDDCADTDWRADLGLELVVSSTQDVSADTAFDDLCDSFLQTAIATAAQETIRSVEQEQFREQEASILIDVPTLDCAFAAAPTWAAIGDDARKHFAFIHVREPGVMFLPPLPRDANEKKLGWVPMRARPRDPLAGDWNAVWSRVDVPIWDDETEENPFLQRRRRVGVGEDDVEMPYMGEVDEDEDEDGAVDERDDGVLLSGAPRPSALAGLAELVMKRRREQEDEEERQRRAPKLARHDEPATKKLPAMLAGPNDTTLDRIRALMVGSDMDLDGLEQASSMSASTTLATPPASKPSISSSQTATSDAVVAPAIDPPPFAAPPNKPLQTRCTYISSLAAIQLTRDVAKLWPSVDFIDRDYTSHDRVEWSRSGSALCQTAVSPLAHEADIAISPLTGLVATNVLSVMQKAAAGADTPLRERIRRVSPLYARLVVLVSENTETSSSLGARELAAYADFVAWTAALPWTIDVSLVPGGQSALARWAVAAMQRHAHEAAPGARLLIARETSWEVFLRRAGVNVFAAQLVANAARALFGEREGLGRFLDMAWRERKEVLEGVLGRVDAVERAWAVLDGAWGVSE